MKRCLIETAQPSAEADAAPKGWLGRLQLGVVVTSAATRNFALEYIPLMEYIAFDGLERRAY